MALTNQVHIYSVDTGFFYTKKERKMHINMCVFKKEKHRLNDLIAILDKELISLGATKSELKKLKKEDTYSSLLTRIDKDKLDEILTKRENYVFYKGEKTKKINKEKNMLLELLSEKLEKHKSPKTRYIREMKEKDIRDNNTISVFESTLTRTIGSETNTLTDDFMVVQVYYFDIIQDIILNGFMYKGEKYKFLTSSAGQIRTKKTVFIKESVWEKHCMSIMCGLSISQINKKGGININKFLAYLALCNSATDLWEDFDINKTIVVPDFETKVNGTVDFIDERDYSIKRTIMDVPIAHTDGCGLISNKLSSKNFMVRMPWIKGLLAVFDFNKFIEEHNCSPIVTDIYGKEWDIVKDDIQVIFTESQFKLHKYYKDWDDYKQKFIENKCQAGKCNIEEDKIPNAQINYQMLQTLTNLTREDMEKISKFSVNKIEKLATTVDSMLNAFGVTKYNTNKTDLQKALEIYPELLNDTYLKDNIRQIKKSLVKSYRAGKLEVKGKFTFLIPDLYAFCEFLFLGKENPDGLLKDQEVFCKLYPKTEKLDCLRSPHLYREHAVRKNVIDEEKKKWFVTDAIYTSSKDLISKILQNDFDGDKSLIIADNFFVSKAEEAMKDIVPLYYNMSKARAVELDNQELYNGLQAAFTGGNIGAISNDITKIWANNVWSSGTEEEKNRAMDIIKLLCCDSNFCIDYAKTLYKPIRPEHINEEIKRMTKEKVPHFFMYAKDKEENNIASKTDTCVNWLTDIIKDKRLSFKKGVFGRIDYKLLMNNSEIEIDEDIILAYTKENKEYHFKINMQDQYSHNFSYISQEIKNNLSGYGYTDVEICDMLVKHLYHIKDSRYKESLWFCYGDLIVENLKKNLVNFNAFCPKCGKRYKKARHNQVYCSDCGGYQKLDVKTIKCIDCGVSVTIGSKSRITRCESCLRVERKRIKRENYLKNKEN